MSTPTAGTIVARNYVPAAAVLADSHQRHHPGAEFAVLVVDALADEIDDLAARIPGARLLTSDDLDLDADEFGRMAMCYSVTEFCTALKPWLMRRLLEDHPHVLYLDPDIEVFAPFADDVAAMLADTGIALTPHVLEPIPRDGLRPNEADIMASGVFNLGFIGLSRKAAPFLRFWSERLRQDAISSIHEQLFTDQRWVDNVPAMFPHVTIADPGYNVAYWNVYQRPLEQLPEGAVTAGGAPLRFLHYSGYRPEKPWLTSVHFADKPRVLLSEHTMLARLFADYRAKLLAAGYPQALEDVPYRWATMPDGTRVSMSLRRAFRQAWMQSERDGAPPPPNPFGAAADLDWATTPATPEQERAGLTPWAMAVWESRLDVQAAFPDPLGANAAAFRDWCVTSGVAEGELPQGALPDRPARRPVAPRDVLGVNVLGYLTTESGVGELGRLVHDAIRESGIPVAISVEESTVVSRTGHPLPEDAPLSDPEYGVSVLCVNADMTPLTLQLHPELRRDRYVIGVWSWELSDFPPSMHPAFAHVNEVWANSEFTAQAIAAHSPVPVHTFPIPVRDPLAGPPAPRAEDDGQTRFLFMFDHESLFDRKNPTAVVTAFQRAFDGREDVRLMVKSINGDRNPGDRERLRAAVADDPRFELIEGYLDHDEISKLYAAADCYVSLHRSEGFGMTVAEAMVRGLPVIATNYSATCELLTDETGWPIPYRIVPVGPGNGPYPQDAHWAEPDIDAAVTAMREVADQPDHARRRGEAARHHLLSTRSMEAAAEWVQQRLSAAHEQWRRSRQPVTVPAGPILAVQTTRGAVHSQADINVPARLPMAPTLRRTVLRVLNHHDEHQRAVLGAVVDGVEAAVTQLIELLTNNDVRTGDRLELLDQQLATTRAALTSLRGMVATGQRQHNELVASSAQRIDQLDRKVMDLLQERDERHMSMVERLERLDQRLAAFQHDAAQERTRLADQLTGLTSDIARIDDDLSAEPYTTEPGVLRIRDADGREVMGYRNLDPSRPATYADFEDLFRGGEDFIRERMQVYVPLLTPHQPIVDLGCGRGELLDVLAAAGIQAQGIDMDASMVERARSKGLSVTNSDALSWLEEQPAGSLGAVFSAQFVEHIPVAELRRLFAVAHRVLRPGGVLVAETVNPHSLRALKTFWLDLTHVHPLFPESLIGLAMQTGFRDAIVRFPHGTGTLAEDRRTEGEYVLVATRGADPAPSAGAEDG